MWWLILHVKLTGHRVPRLNTVSLRVFLGEISIWTGGLAKADGPAQYRWAPSKSLRVWKEFKVEEGEICPLFFFFTVELGHLIFSCPQALQLWFFGLEPNYTAGFPGLPVCTQQIVGLLSFHNPVSQFLIVHLLLCTLHVAYYFGFPGEPWLLYYVLHSTYGE